MCGINGLVNRRLSQESAEDQLNVMNQLIQHRGPDSQDIFYDSGIGLGHTRLSILDLSNTANQPMISFSGRFIIVFNGEIYNFQELSNLLINKFNIKFKTSSDTEVLLNLVDCLGIDKTLSLIEGMFAFAVYDQKNKKIILARDRFGEKPIFWYKTDETFYFSSELSPLTFLLKKGLLVVVQVG